MTERNGAGKGLDGMERNGEAELSRKTGVSERVLREIRELAEKHGVEKVILFGSRARGDFRERSDIDIAFTGGDAPRFSLDVDEETYTLLCSTL